MVLELAPDLNTFSTAPLMADSATAEDIDDMLADWSPEFDIPAKDVSAICEALEGECSTRAPTIAGNAVEALADVEVASATPD